LPATPQETAVSWWLVCKQLFGIQKRHYFAEKRPLNSANLN